MSPGDVDIDRRPFVLVWEVTQACDLSCDHCRADATPECHPDELDTAEGKALLADARRFGDDQLVVLSGGDPAKRDDLAELISYGDDLGLQMTLTPSGTESLTRDRIQAVADAGLRRMALSLDGSTAERHDDFRGEPGSFEATMRAAGQAREAGLPLQVNTTVCARTVDDLPAIRDRVRELGAVLWSVFFLVPVGRGAVLESISPERAEGVMAWLGDVADEHRFGVKTTEAPQYRRVRVQQRRGTDDASENRGLDRRGGIRAGAGFAFVSHVGEIFPSGFLPLDAGNVHTDDLVDVYRNAELFESLRNPDAYTGKCGACEFRYVCGGSRSRAYATTGDPLASDPLCAYVPEGYDGPLPDGQEQVTSD